MRIIPSIEISEGLRFGTLEEALLRREALRAVLGVELLLAGTKRVNKPAYLDIAAAAVRNFCPVSLREHEEPIHLTYPGA